MKSALKRIAWQAPLTAVLFLVGAHALHRAWFGAGLTATARRFLPRLETEVDRLLAPLVAPVVQHALGGERAVSIERFLRALRERLVPWDTSAGASRPPSLHGG